MYSLRLSFFLDTGEHIFFVPNAYAQQQLDPQSTLEEAKKMLETLREIRNQSDPNGSSSPSTPPASDLGTSAREEFRSDISGRYNNSKWYNRFYASERMVMHQRHRMVRKAL